MALQVCGGSPRCVMGNVAVTHDSTAALLLPSPGHLPSCFPRWGQLFVCVEKSPACEGTALCRIPLGLVCPERWANFKWGAGPSWAQRKGESSLCVLGKSAQTLPTFPLGSVLTATAALSSWANLDPGASSTLIWTPALSLQPPLP